MQHLNWRIVIFWCGYTGKFDTYRPGPSDDNDDDSAAADDDDDAAAADDDVNKMWKRFITLTFVTSPTAIVRDFSWIVSMSSLFDT